MRAVNPSYNSIVEMRHENKNDIFRMMMYDMMEMFAYIIYNMVYMTNN